MRNIARVLIAVLALLVISSPPAVAGGRGGGGHPRIVPVGTVAGSTGGRILGDWFVENLSRPASASPFGGTANLCYDVGRHDRVLAPAGGIQKDRLIEMTCTVEVGRPVVMVLPTSDCSTAEDPPFYGATAREQRRCAIEQVQGYVKALSLSVDGGEAVNILRPRFFEVSPQRRVVFPEDPVFGADVGPAKFVAAGWLAEIRGMKKGTHTATSVGTIVVGADGTTAVDTYTVHFEVVGHRR